jgi:amino acid transporter
LSVRRLGLGSSTALVVAAMIGTGVFTTSGYLLQMLRSPAAVLAVWGLGGVIAVLGAVSYGALARRIPESGGEYVFLSRTIHPAAGYLAGWVTLVAGLAAPAAANALGFAHYLRPWLPEALPLQVTASLLLLAAAALHAGAMSRAALVQRIAVALEVLLIAALLFGGLGHQHAQVAEPLKLGALGPALILVSYSYSGWNTVVYVGGEVSNPTRNLPRAMMIGAVGVTAIYLALNAVFVYSVPAAALMGKADVGRIAAEAIGGPRLAAAVAGLIAFVLATFVSSMMMAGPHVIARMAGDGYLPRALAATTGQPPRAALLLQLLLSLVMVWTEKTDALLTYVGFTLGLSTAATVVGLIRLKRREGDALPVWGWPWVPGLFLLFVLGSTAFAIVQAPLSSSIALVTLMAGLLAFRLHGHKPA